MAKISVVNRNTISKRLGTYLAIGGIIFVAYSGIEISKNVAEGWKYSNRRGGVEELMKEGKLSEAESVLRVYGEGNGLEKPDLDALGIRLDNQKRRGKFTSLDRLIKSGAHDEAQALYFSLKQEGLIKDKLSRVYTQKIKDISLEGVLERISTSTGKDKIDSINRLILGHPNYEGTGELRKIQGREYLSISKSYFDLFLSVDSTSLFLDKFYRWIKQRDPSIIKKIDFSEFFDTSKDYLRLKKLNKTKQVFRDLEVGDTVMTVRNLGELNGQDKESYYHGGSVDTLPIGSEGVIKYKGSEKIRINFEKISTWSFVPREVKRISSFMKEEEALSKIKLQIGNIRNYVSGIKEENKDGTWWYTAKTKENNS